MTIHNYFHLVPPQVLTDLALPEMMVSIIFAVTRAQLPLETKHKVSFCFSLKFSVFSFF
jgi:hypothetical protein